MIPFPNDLSTKAMEAKGEDSEKISTVSVSEGQSAAEGEPGNAKLPQWPTAPGSPENSQRRGHGCLHEEGLHYPHLQYNQKAAKCLRVLKGTRPDVQVWTCYLCCLQAFTVNARKSEKWRTQWRLLKLPST